MEYRRLGASGLTVSRICLGMMSYGDPSATPWFVGEDQAEAIVRRAVEAGITFFDTADGYSSGLSEEITGRLLARFFGRRDDFVVATKVFFPTGPGPNDKGLSRKHILSAIDASLRRLGVDYVDLYQIHRWDYDTPVEETMEALNDVVRAGKARYLGASATYAWQFAKAQQVARANNFAQFVSMQNRYNVLYREEEREMIPLCLDQGVGVIPYSPLARGALARTLEESQTRSTVRAQNDTLSQSEVGRFLQQADRRVVAAVRAAARRRGIPPAQVALAWLLRQPAVTAPIVGMTKPRHLADAVGALAVALSDREAARLEAPYQPHPILGHS